MHGLTSDKHISPGNFISILFGSVHISDVVFPHSHPTQSIGRGTYQTWQSICQSINRAVINQPIDPTINQPIYQPTRRENNRQRNQSVAINRSTAGQLINLPANPSADKTKIDRRINERTNQSRDQSANESTNRSINRRGVCRNILWATPILVRRPGQPSQSSTQSIKPSSNPSRNQPANLSIA